MAKIELFLPKLLKLEGDFVDDPKDHGGATNKGITLTTFRSFYGKTKTVYDLKHISQAQVQHIYKVGYWDKCRADEIKNQSIAEIIVDWAVNSGVSTAVKSVQRTLGGLSVDGVCGPHTISKINTSDAFRLFSDLKTLRIHYYNNIVYKNPSQRKFLNGWLNRINTYKFE